MANKKDSLGDRMKGNYESVTKTKLVKRMPVAIRIDGKAFHTFTRGFNKPYDLVLSKRKVIFSSEEVKLDRKWNI